MAGSVVGHLFTAVVEVLFGQAEDIMHEGAVVRHLVGEKLHAGGVGLAFQDVGVHMLQVGGAAGAQGAGAAGSNAGSNDDVIDGDFKEV